MKKIVSMVLISLVLMSTSFAEAKYSEVLKLEYDVLWNTTIRFIRVDKDWPIDDKDKDNKYIIFQYKKKDGKEKRASIEFIQRTSDKEGNNVSYEVVVKIDKTSSVDEQIVIEAIKKKLYEEKAHMLMK